MNKFNLFLKARFHVFVIMVVIVGVVILFNRFSFRWDLTQNQIFTLSQVSQALVKDLKDPLRIKVFISKNLPPPLNDLPTAMEDILIEYQEASEGSLIYNFYDVTESEEGNPQIEANIKLASDYGIEASQVQTLDKDQMQLIKVYSGVVIEYGNLIERIPFVTGTSRLEYQITTILDKMNKKLNSLLALEAPITAKLYLSQDFVQVSPLFQIEGLSGITESMTSVFEKVNQENYGKVEFEVVSQINAEDMDFLNRNQVRMYPWNEFRAQDGKTIPAGQGVAALMLSHGDKVEWVELLAPQASLQIGSQGLQQVVRYVLINLDNYQNTVDGIIDSLLDINDYIAYLDDKETVSVESAQGNPMFQQSSGGEAANFYNLLGENYTVERVDLEKLNLKYKTLVIAGAKEKFSDYELFLIDQFLMQGKSLLILQDALAAEPSLPGARTLPKWLPVNNGLEKLLEHYGVRIQAKYVMDKESYISRSQGQNGGAVEQRIYFAPIIQDQNINHDFIALRNFKTFITLEMSPIALIEERLKEQKVDAIPLFSSSTDSWVQADEPNLIPMMITPPQDVGDYQKSDLAYLLEGEFKSFFADKPIPSRSDSPDSPDLPEGDEAKSDPVSQADTPLAVQDGGLIKKTSQPGKIIVVGSSSLIKNNLVDQQGDGGNAKLMINIVDYLSDREDWAVMRSKDQRVVPLESYNAEAPGLTRWLTHRGALKWFNMLGLPIVVILVGIAVYAHRTSRRRRIFQIFKDSSQE